MVLMNLFSLGFLQKTLESEDTVSCSLLGPQESDANTVTSDAVVQLLY